MDECRQAAPAVKLSDRTRLAFETLSVHGWRLERRPNAPKPKRWRLWSPLWLGAVEVSTVVLFDPRKLSHAVFRQTEVFLDAQFREFWRGKRIITEIDGRRVRLSVPGALQQLVEAAQ